MIRLLLNKAAFVKPIRTLANQTLAQWMPQSPQMFRLQQQDQRRDDEAADVQRKAVQAEADIAATAAHKQQRTDRRSRRYGAIRYFFRSLLAAMSKFVAVPASQSSDSSAGDSCT